MYIFMHIFEGPQEKIGPYPRMTPPKHTHYDPNIIALDFTSYNCMMDSILLQNSFLSFQPSSTGIIYESNMHLDLKSSKCSKMQLFTKNNDR